MSLSKRRVKSKNEIRHQNTNKAMREASKRKMLEALAKLELEFASFSNWLAESGLARAYFNELLNELLEERKVGKVIFVGSHPRYHLIETPNWVSLEYLSSSYLYMLLEKIRTSTDREQATNNFNRYLGSLIAYLLKTHDANHSQEILRVILTQIQSYLNYPEPKTLMGQPLTKKEPNVESDEWVLWRDIDSREYITTVKVPKSLEVIESEECSNEKAKNQLPCSGRCRTCKIFSNGCWNRLAEARKKIEKEKAKNISAIQVGAIQAMEDLSSKKNQKIDAVIEIEAIDRAKFNKKWLNSEKTVT